ncbi:glycosyltransferase family 2 protein [Phormidium sp. FACHB-592]|uniref:Glycosyltransferase n=1 Tax=Stenomitos frigidus AS-A4 TaxID=2933935 RepID=A0ABV0KL01_9CYAN|nr:glycosyltransferase family 2 protein [Phormidium sp. FACHB-592]MBD2075737.1 glycosyltransferase family 2 protein [Phormidium sp. FACHB-592]
MNYPCEKQSLPLVSVIIPAYNAEQFVERTLNSVLNQTYQKLEVIVIDDGSHDRTAEIVSEIAHRDDRVILLHQPNSGVAAARNLGIQHSRGEFIAPIDADDLWHPENIAKQVHCFANSNSNVGLVYSWSLDIDEHDLPTGETHAAQVEGNVYLTLLCHYFLANASASLIRRNCLQKVGSYNCQFKKQNAQGCEDWDFYLRVAEQFEFRSVPEFLVGYRKIQHSMSCNYSSMASSHTLMLQLIRSRHPEIPALIYRLSSSSFYMYLARQSEQQGDYQSTLSWLQKALETDWLISSLRTELYTLSIKVFLRSKFQAVTSSSKLSYHFSKQLKRENGRSSSDEKLTFNFNPKKLNQSKSTLEILLHKFLSILALKLRVKNQKFQNRLSYKKVL